MAKNNNITAGNPSDGLRDRFDDFARDHGYNDSQAAAKAIDEGLARLGYGPDVSDPATLLLHYVRASGLTLGLAGMILIGLGLFSTFDYRFLGFLLASTGGVLIATQWGLKSLEPALSQRLGIETHVTDGTQE